MVDIPTITMKLGTNPLVAIAGKLQTDGFNPFLESLLPILFCRRFLLRGIIETASWKIHELTPPLDFLEPVEANEKEFSLLSAFSRVCVKAFLRSPFSRVSWPTNRSSFTMRSAKAASRVGSLPNFPRAYCVFQ